MHDSLASSLSKGVVEIRSVVLCQVVPDERLAAVFVYPLEDLMTTISI